MVTHDVTIAGVDLQGNSQTPPVLLQMNQEDFPKRFLSDLAGAPALSAQLSSSRVVSGSFQQPGQLYQPVQRILHVAMLQVACDSVGAPPLDPQKIEKVGLVIRRLRSAGSGQSSPDEPYQAWMQSSDGRFRWRVPDDPCADPDPKLRPQLQSGQAYLDAQLAAPVLASAWSEVYSSAFVAPPDTNSALGRTVVYAVVPTASSDVSDVSPATPTYTDGSLAGSLPTLLQSSNSAVTAPAAGQTVDARWLADDYSASKGYANFKVFASTLLMLYRQFGAFDDTDEGRKILAILDKRNVSITKTDASGSAAQTVKQSMASFYRDAKSKLIDADPSGGNFATLVMPSAWDSLSTDDENALLAAMGPALQKRASLVQPPEGRYQNSDRLYVLRFFFRVKGQTPQCPAELHWSSYSQPFRIAAWYDSSQRAAAPIPLPDPTSRGFLTAAMPNVAFSVPKGLMNAMGSSLSDLTGGSPKGNNFNLNWICGFNIPLITICAFFVLNIFLSLLNIVFFWLPFIKICIPFPLTMPASGDD